MGWTILVDAVCGVCDGGCDAGLARVSHPPQDVIRSRMRLHITDGFKVIYNGGPLDRDPRARVPHEAVYVSTDPVAMDRIGWQVVDKWRVDRGLPTLEKAKREPIYIQRAADMGLGIADLNRIRMKVVDL